MTTQTIPCNSIFWNDTTPDFPHKQKAKFVTEFISSQARQWPQKHFWFLRQMLLNLAAGGMGDELQRREMKKSRARRNRDGVPPGDQCPPETFFLAPKTDTHDFDKKANARILKEFILTEASQWPHGKVWFLRNALRDLVLWKNCGRADRHK